MAASGPGKPRDAMNKFPALEATRRMNSLNNPTAVDGLLYSQIAAMAAMSDMMRARDVPSQAAGQSTVMDSAPAFDKAMLERLAKQAAEEPMANGQMLGPTGTSSSSSAPPPPPPPVPPPSPPQEESAFKLPPGFKMVRFDTAEEAEKAISELDRCEVAEVSNTSAAESTAEVLAGPAADASESREGTAVTAEAALAAGAAARGWGRGKADVAPGGKTSQVRSIVDGVLGAWKATAATSRASAALAPQAKAPSAVLKASATSSGADAVLRGFECIGESDSEDGVEVAERGRNQREIDAKRRSKSAQRSKSAHRSKSGQRSRSGQRSKSGARRRGISKSPKRSRSCSSRKRARSGRRKHPRHRSRSSGSRSRSRKRSKSRSRKRSRSRSKRRSRSRSRKRSSIFSSEPQAAEGAKSNADKHQSKFQDPGGVNIRKDSVPDWLKDLENPVPSQYMGRKVLRMPDAYIKCLIGRGGETIRNIINKTGADIRIEGKPDDPDGIVSIAGNIEAAEGMIRNMLAEKGCVWEIRDATGPVGGMSDVTWKSNVDVDDLQIPTELVGLFIGNSGAGIKEIKAKVGGAVTIKVLPPILPGGFQCVQVVGDHWKRAKEIVRAKIEEIKITTPGRWHTPGFGPTNPGMNGTAPAFPGYMPGFGATPGASYAAAAQKATPAVHQGVGNGTRL